MRVRAKSKTDVYRQRGGIYEAGLCESGGNVTKDKGGRSRI